jgi:hypothetical protein
LRFEEIEDGTKCLEGLAVGRAAVEEGRAVEWLSGENSILRAFWRLKSDRILIDK